MAITISGENNNDKILATDGVIDQISGINIVGVLTATSFTGDLTGDVTGNLTGNVTGNINNTTLLLQTGGTERLRIDSAGHVLIGTSAPGYSTADDLTIATSGSTGITIRTGTTNQGNIYFADGTSGASQYAGLISYNHANNFMFFGTNDGTERLRIDSGGQVQIGSGTIHGGGHLTIRGGGVNTYATLDYQYVGTPSNNSTTLAQLRFTANTTGASVVQGAKIQAVSDAAWSATGDAPTRLEFHTAPDGSSSMAERLRITSAGTLKFTGQNTSLETAGITHHTNNNLYIRGGTTGLVLGNHDNTNTIHVSNSNFIKFETTDGSERVRITSNGNLLIGKTADSGKPLEVYQAGDAAIRIQNNASGTGSNDGILLEIGNTSKDALIWNYESANMLFGTAGTERLRIKNDGKVGINQSSPRTTLDVTGYVYLGNGGQIQITGSPGAKGLQMAGQDDGDNIIGTMGSSGENLLFRTASSERMRLLVGGSHLLLGGTASVNEITESSAHAGMVIGGTGYGNAGLAIITSTSGTGRLYFGDSVGGNAGRNRGQINYYHNGDYMNFVTAGSERLRIDTNGHLTITGANPIISFIDSDNNSDYRIQVEAGTFLIEDVTNSYADRFIINSSGFIGINQNNPTHMLDVLNGNLRLQTNTGFNANNQAYPTIFLNANHSSGNNPAHGAISVRHSNQNTYSGDIVIMPQGYYSSYGYQEVLTVSAYRRVGVMCTPSATLHVRDTGTANSNGFRFETGTNGQTAKFVIKTTDNGDESKYLRLNGHWTELGVHNNEGFRIRNSSNGIALYVNSGGSYAFSGSNLSDRNLKEDIETISTPTIDLIKQVSPKLFKWKNDINKTQHGGFIAQEMQPLFPKLISGTDYDESRTDYGDPNEDQAPGNPTGLAFDYDGYTAYLTKAVQELIAKVESLETEVASLKSS